MHADKMIEGGIPLNSSSLIIASFVVLTFVKNAIGFLGLLVHARRMAESRRSGNSFFNDSISSIVKKCLRSFSFVTLAKLVFTYALSIDVTFCTNPVTSKGLLSNIDETSSLVNIPLSARLCRDSPSYLTRAFAMIPE